MGAPVQLTPQVANIQAAFFPAMHYIFGAWYRGDEIARRGGVFYVGLTLGTLTAGLIQAGASASLDGVNGLAGWYVLFTHAPQEERKRQQEDG